MIGLLYLLVGVIYLAVMIVAIRMGWRIGKEKNKKRAFGYAFIGFLVVYLPLFWDHIPTLLLHRYYCAQDAGLTVYVTPEQWLKEHEAELEQIRIPSLQERIKTIEMPDGWHRNMVNKKVVYNLKIDKVVSGLVEINRGQVKLVDISTGVVLAAYVSYSSGKPFESGGLRLWMNIGSCLSQEAIGQLSIMRSKLELGG